MHDKQLSKTPLVVFKRKDYFLAIVHPFSPLLFFFLLFHFRQAIRIYTHKYFSIYYYLL